MKYSMRRTIATLGVVAVLFFSLLGMGCYCWMSDLVLVREADYCVAVPGMANATGRFYSLDASKHVLVLSSGDSIEAYYVDLDARDLGLPSFPYRDYTPFWRCALMNRIVLDGYPDIGALAADWSVSEGEIRIRVTGVPPEVQRTDPIPNRDEFERQFSPIAYSGEIILTRR